MRIALFASLQRPHALEIVRRTVSWLHDYDQTVQMGEPLARAVSCVECGIPEDRVVDGADFAISVGGDGTMLGAVRTCAPASVPVLGVNAGALGFLTEITPEELPTSLPRLLNGEYTLESRMMLEASHYRGNTPLNVMRALNDVVVRQGAKGRLVTLHLLIAGHDLADMGADGVIVSTPSGSTAYGLAAGGPIVHPVVSVMVLVPICPHSLSFRPMVVPATDPVEIICVGNPHNDEMMLTADGQEPVIVHSGDRVVIRPAPEPALLVKFGLSSFYDRLREKLQWGGK
ncbi:MAG: NAD(+)/NADH kinase [Armatimonadota bacterium]